MQPHTKFGEDPAFKNSRIFKKKSRGRFSCSSTICIAIFCQQIRNIFSTWAWGAKNSFVSVYNWGLPRVWCNSLLLHTVIISSLHLRLGLVPWVYLRLQNAATGTSKQRFLLKLSLKTSDGEDLWFGVHEHSNPKCILNKLIIIFMLWSLPGFSLTFFLTSFNPSKPYFFSWTHLIILF